MYKNQIYKWFQETEALCRRVGIIHDTFFGAFWVFSNKSQERSETVTLQFFTKKNQYLYKYRFQEEFHEDTAYTSDAIGPHTDGTYFQQTPGIQVTTAKSLRVTVDF